jgi:DNA-binding response OmpR family regulator
MTVLVVDDHSELRKMAAQFLEILGHLCLQAGTQAEAEATVASPGQPVDVVLLDMNLGDHSGVPLASRLEQARPGLRTLFMSGMVQEEDVSPVLQHPRRHFIGKPFTLDALQAALNRLAAAD